MLKVSYAGIELADGSRTGSSVEAMRDPVKGTATVQEEQLIRDGQPTFFERFGISNELDIKVRKQVSHSARALYLTLMRRQTLPGTGVLVITQVLDGVTRTYTAARAACKVTDAVAGEGASMVVTYRIKCGTFEYATTAEEPDDQIDGGSDIDMGTQILLRRHPRATILGLIAAESFADAEPWFETDGGRSGVGNRAADVSKKDLGTIAIDTTGASALGLVTWATEHRVLIVVTWTGAFAYDFVLPITATGLDASEMEFLEGDTIEARVEIGAGTAGHGPVSFWNDEAVGTALLALTVDAVARNYIAQFRYTGAAWAIWDVRQINA